MADIFLSYKAEDRARVKPLVDALVAEGLSVWWDVHIEGGAAWRAAIERELESAACVMVVWSEASVGPAGHFVQDEATRGQRRGVYLPVAIDEVAPPLGFGQQQALKLVGWRGGRRDPRYLDVLAAARAMVGGDPRPTPTAPARRARRRWPSRIWLVAGLVALAVAAAGGAWLSRPQPRPANSLAVLPFSNLSGDPGQDYFSDGLSEELVSTLARLKPLHVAASASSFRFKGSHEASAVIGARLGVVWLLDGSVRREGQTVRVSAELADARTGFERWNATYDRDLKDIFAVQSGIAQAVAEALKVQLFGGDIAALSLNGTTSPEAYDAYLRGRQLLEQGAGEAGYREALARFDAAIAADPRYASAYAGRATTLVYLANQFEPPARLAATYDAALTAARQAADLGPDLGAVQATLASTLVYARHDFSAAKAAFARAEALGGGDATVLAAYGPFLCWIGDCGAGVATMRRVVALDPLNPAAFKTLAIILIAARRYDEAIGAMRRAEALSPRLEFAHVTIGDALALQGRYDEARAEYALEPIRWARRTGEAIVSWRLGDKAAARSALADVIADGGEANAYQEAQIQAQWGEPDRAIAALDTAFAHDDSGLLMLAVDPMLDPLRRDPRFLALLSRMRLTGPGV